MKTESLYISHADEKSTTIILCDADAGMQGDHGKPFSVRDVSVSRPSLTMADLTASLSSQIIFRERSSDSSPFHASKGIFHNLHSEPFPRRAPFALAISSSSSSLVKPSTHAE